MRAGAFAALGLFAIVYWAVGLTRTGWDKAADWFLFELIGGALVVVPLLAPLMVIKHPPVTWPDVRRMYYWVPTSTLFLFMATVALRGALGLGLPRLAVRVVLVSNLASLPTHRHYLETDHLSAEMAYSPSLLEALKHTADSAYDPGGTVGEGPVYQLALRWQTCR